MEPVSDVDEVQPGCLFWQLYDPAVKADLSSTALLTEAGVLIIDPVALSAEGLEHLRAMGNPCAVIATNANHARAGQAIAEAFSIPVYAHEEALNDPDFAGAKALPPASELGLENIVELPGFGLGEVALLTAGPEPVLVVGDALIHMESFGFDLLPAKYCQNRKQGEKSAKQLADLDFEVLCFAHGTPLRGLAREKLRSIVNHDE